MSASSRPAYSSCPHGQGGADFSRKCGENEAAQCKMSDIKKANTQDPEK